jgi:hypothetical protein
MYNNCSVHKQNKKFKLSVLHEAVVGLYCCALMCVTVMLSVLCCTVLRLSLVSIHALFIANIGCYTQRPAYSKAEIHSIWT